MSQPTSVAPSRLTLILNAAPVPVSSLADALARVRAFVREHGIAATDYGETCGRIERNGAPYCRVSYHGRLWALDAQGRETYREMDERGEVAP